MTKTPKMRTRNRLTVELEGIVDIVIIKCCYFPSGTSLIEERSIPGEEKNSAMSSMVTTALLIRSRCWTLRMPQHIAAIAKTHDIDIHAMFDDILVYNGAKRRRTVDLAHILPISGK